MKAMPDTTAEEAWTTSEERMKELIANAWDTVKRLTLQVANFALTFLFLCLEPSQLKQIHHYLLYSGKFFKIW